MLENRAKDKNNIYVWGAATKGCMFLIHCAGRGKITNKLPFAVDINPQKVGKFLPMTKIPIRSKDDFFAHATNNDLLIICNPAYRNEICCELAANGLDQMDVCVL